MSFDTVLMVDWSGGRDRGPKPKRDAIWACQSGADGTEAPVYLRNRQLAEDWIVTRLDKAMGRGQRVLAGFDFPFAAPDGFAEALTGSPDPLALWHWLDDRIEDRPKENNRFDVAALMNSHFPRVGPFWGNGLKREIPHLPRRGKARTFCWTPARRATELAAKGSFEIWQLSGAGSVGSQALLGMPVLERIRRRFAGRLAVWPFQRDAAPITLVEIWPSLLSARIAAEALPNEIRDAAQVRVLASALSRLSPATTEALLAPPPAASVQREGWILGVGHEAELQRPA